MSKKMDATYGLEPTELIGRVRKLIDDVGGVNEAARLFQVSRNTTDGWYQGRSRIPFAAALRLMRQVQAHADPEQSEQPSPMSQVMTMDASPPDGFIPVPMLEIRPSAGNGIVALDRHPSENVLSLRGDWLRQIGLAPGRTEAMFVTGDSMHPTIRDGDLILVDRQIDRVVDGGIYVLVVNGEVRVKRVFVRTNGALILKSDNDVWPEELVPADEVNDLSFEGRVRWFGRMI